MRDCPTCADRDIRSVCSSHWNRETVDIEYYCPTCGQEFSEDDLDRLWKDYWIYHNNLTASQKRELENDEREC